MLADISQGAYGHSRIGDEVFIRRFILKGALLGGQTGLTSDDSYNQIRLLLFIGPPNANMGTQLTNYGIGLYSPITPSTCPLVYKKLYDKVIHLKSPGFDGTTGYIPTIKHCKISKRINRRATFLYGTTTPSRWDLYFMYVSDSALPTHPGFQASTRIWLTFTDS